MAININLLPEVKSEEKKKASQLKTANMLVAGIALLSLVVMIVIVVISMRLDSNLDNLISDITKQEKVIDDNEEVEVLLSGLKSHTGSLETVLTERKKFSVFLSQFSKYIPSTIKITDVVANQNGDVSLTGSAPTYEKLAGFVLVLSGQSQSESGETPQETDEPIFSDVTLTSVSRNTEGNDVRFTLTFMAKEGAFNE